MAVKNSYEDICLSVVPNLNTKVINTSLSALVENDVTILPKNNYIPSIWERKWFNDDSIPGYNVGDVVWKYVLDGDQFLKNYASLVFDYAKKNDRLKFYLSSANYANDKDKFHNVISGYQEIVGYDISSNPPNRIPIWKQFLPSLFDYCYDYQTNTYRYEDSQMCAVQIYISLSDNNKAELSDTNYWHNIVLKTNNELSTYLSTAFQKEIDQHIKNYHLDGAKELSTFDSLLLKRDFSNFNMDEIYNPLTVINHNAYINSYGFDYVIKFAKTQISSYLSGVNDPRPMYKWYRLWNSGYLEHGGVVYVPSCDFKYSENISSYIISVNLDWIDDSGNYAPIYDYPRLLSTTSFYGEQYDKLYYGINKTSSIIDDYQTNNKFLGQQKRYSISLTPVILIESDILSSGRYDSFEKLSSLAYPSPPTNDFVSSYINVEVLRQQNESFQLIRSNTSDLTDLSTSRYVQYYTSGYLTRTRLNYFISSATIENLNPMYYYSSEPVSPDIVVKANDGYLMDKNVDYYITLSGYNIPTGQTSSIMSVYVNALYPYKGKLSATTILVSS